MLVDGNCLVARDELLVLEYDCLSWWRCDGMLRQWRQPDEPLAKKSNTLISYVVEYGFGNTYHVRTSELAWEV
jgi:hypothetical protein